jgi:hypothetical protein
VRKAYRDDWTALTADFEPTGAKDWPSLERGGGLAYRPGGGGVRTIRQFLRAMADRYYTLMRDTIRQHDSDALFLGDRYQSFYYPEVARSSAGYVDVSSTNLNASWNDGTFLRSYLASLHGMTGKPILVSEFYLAAAENRSGNPNASSGFPVVATQRERAVAARRTLHALASLPYVVGADWFQYYDEPPHGRGDGEDYNFGLVDIQNRPYREITTMFSEFDAIAHRSSSPLQRPNATSGVPPATQDPLVDFKFMTALRAWDRERGFVPSASACPPADLYICWSPEALYLGLYAHDVVEKELYHGGVVPDVDRACWSVRLGESEPIDARIGCGVEPVVNRDEVQVKCLSGFDHDVRLIAVMKLPTELLGKRQWTAGESIALSSELVTHAQMDRCKWTCELVLAK